MSWILIAVIAYLILALVNLADKFLLEKFIPSAKTYTFLIGVLSLGVFILAPWGLEWPGGTLWIYNILVGGLFPVALLLLYKALKEGEASQMITIVGAALPVFTVLLSMTILGESFSPRQWLAIALLVLGTIVLSWFPDAHELWHKVWAWFKAESINQRLGIISAISAGFFLSLFFIGSKYLFDTQPFISAFIWLRLGTSLVSFLLLIPGDFRREILAGLKKFASGRGQVLFFGTQLVAAVGFILQNYAIALGSVAIVNALQGVQYVSLLIIASIISIFYPQAIKENISRPMVIKKLVAIVLIVLGLYLVAL